MSKFVLTAQLQLQAPNNTAQVVRQIQNQLQGVKVDLQVQNAQKAQSDVRGLSDGLDQAEKSAGKLGGTLRASIRRFTALAIATRAVGLFTSTLGKAVESAIDFERELVKISQVTGKTMSDLRGLTNEITRLSTSLGVSSQSILSVGRILSQAGLNAKETQVALSTLARTELAPTFDDITQTAEGAVAIFNQFKQGAESLEAQLGSLNAVAGQFAVESGDLISVIRRTGGVFKQAGGDLNELIALFTSVRSTTRESAESIATGLRTIFTRIQRPETIKYLEQFGVKLTDLEGRFVGPYKAVGELNKALAGLEEGDITFVQIAEELGGFRQIGKVLPLIKEYAVAQEALKVAQDGSNSLAADAAKAQASLAVRIIKVKEEFLALVRSISETSTFQIMANGALGLASALIKITDAIKPLIPLLGVLAGVKLAKGLAGAFGGFLGGGRQPSGFNKGGKVHAFATGGLVPGVGNSDTVPAMLTPGEFVIRKSSVAKLGANNLAAMNHNRYNKGGKFVPIKITGDSAANPQIGQISPTGKPGVKTTKNVRTTLGEAGIKPKKGESPNTEARLTANVKDITLGEESGPFSYDEVVKPGLQFIDEDIKQSLKSIGIKSTPQKIQNDKAAQNVVSGYAFESFAAGILGKTAEGGSADFDFINPSQSMSDYTKTDPIPRLLDAKNTLQPAAAIAQKAFGYKKRNPQDISFRRMNVGGLIQKLKDGGIAKAPLVDDILQASGSILPKPSLAVQSLISAGGGAVDIDRTLKRTIGDAAYGKARTRGEQSAALNTYFRDPKKRLQDIKSAPLTQFGKELQAVIKGGQLEGKSVSIISKSQRVPGVAEYLSQLFSIPSANMIFTQGGDKQPALDAIRTKGPRVDRIKKHLGGMIQKFANGGKAKDFGKIGFRSTVGGNLTATYLGNTGRSGMVSANYNNGIYTVGLSKATSGYGPMLYDVVMELATSLGSMLAPDRNQISKDAQGVWSYYFNKRNDVTKHPLDPSQWTKNQSLIDPKLWGNKETWPPKTDPAWILQSGYKKPQRITTDPSRAINLNDPKYADFIRQSQMSYMKPAQKKQFGGIIQKLKDGSTGTGVAPARNRMGMTPEQVAAAEERKRLREQAKTGAGGTLQLKSGIVGGLFLQEGSGGKSGIDKSLQGVELPGFAEGSKRLKASIYTGKLRPEAGQAIRNELKPNITQAVQNAATSSISALEISPLDIDENAAAKKAVNKIDLTSIEGYIFEAFTSALTGLQLSDAGATFDYVNPSGRARQRVGQLFSSGLSNEKLLDAKRTLNTESIQSGKSSIANKIIAGIKGGLLGPQDFAKFATGGPVGTDTVPALLTPGEFVINRKSAQSIGYGKLNRMNKVGKYAKGGVVQRFNDGSSGTGVKQKGFSFLEEDNTSNTGSAQKQFNQTIEESTTAVQEHTKQVEQNEEQQRKGFLGFGAVNEGLFAASAALGYLTPVIDENSSTFEKMTAGVIGTFQQLTSTALALSGTFTAVSAQLQGTKLGDTLNSFTKGLKIKDIGKFLTGSGGKIANRAESLARMASSGRGVQGAVAMGELASAVTTVVGGLIGATTATYLFTSAIDGFMDRQSSLNKAIEEGNVAQAETIAANKAAAEYTTNFSTALAAGLSVVPGIGPVFGALIAGGIKLASELPLIGTAIGQITSTIGYAFGGKSLSTIKAEAAVRAQATKTTKALSEATEVASAAMREFKEGNISALEALARMNPAANEVQASFEQTSRQNKSRETKDKSGMFGGTGRFLLRWGTAGLAGLAGVESGSQRNERIDAEIKKSEEEQKKADKELVKSAEPITNAVMRQFANTGGSLQQFRNELDRTSPNLLAAMERQAGGADKLFAKGSDLSNAFENLQKEAARTKAAFDAMNLGMMSIVGAANAGVLAIDNYSRSQQMGGTTLDSVIPTLEASITSAAQGISPDKFNATLDSASDSLRKLGATDEQIKKFEGNVSAVNAAQRNMPAIFESTKAAMQAEFARGNQSGGTVIQRREAFATSVTDSLRAGGIQDESILDNFKKQIEGADIGDELIQKIADGDFSAFEEVITKIGDNALKQILPALKAQAEAEKKLLEFTKRRLELEKQFIDAQKQAIDMTVEAREIQAKYGGEAFTPEMRTQSIVDKANFDASNIRGVGPLKDGSAASLTDRIEQINKARSEIADRRKATAMGAAPQVAGQEGVELSNQQKQLNDLLKQQYSSTKALIDAKVQELNLVKEKNKLERDSMDALINNDIDAFFDNLSAQGAQAALATGDQRALNLLGGRAIGLAAQENRRLQEAGVTEIYGQRLGGPGGLTERGFQEVADRTGIVDPTFAQAAAGTTVEEAAIEKEIRDLAETLKPLGDAMVSSARDELEIAQMQESSAKQQYEAAIQQVAAAQAQANAAGVKGPVAVATNNKAGASGNSNNGVSGSANAGQAAVNQANVNAQTAVINVNNAEVSGGGGGGISGAMGSIYNSGGRAVVEAGNMARNAFKFGKTNIAGFSQGLKGSVPTNMFDDAADSFLSRGYKAGDRLRKSGLLERGQALVSNFKSGFKDTGMLQKMLPSSVTDSRSFKAGSRISSTIGSGKTAISNLSKGFKNTGLLQQMLPSSVTNTRSFKVGSNISSAMGSFANSPVGKIGNFIGSKLPKLSTDTKAQSYLAQKAAPFVSQSAKYVAGKVPGLAKGAMSLGQTGLDTITKNLTKAGNLRIPGLDNIGPKISGALEFGLKKASKIPVLGKLAGGGAKMLGAGAKGIPGLGTALDAVMELGSFAYDREGYHQDKKDKTSRDFGGMLESWSLGFLKTGTQLDSVLATVIGGLEGFLNPVGKVVEGLYNLVGGVQDAYTYFKSSSDLNKQEKKTSESMSETTRKRAEEAGYTGGTENYDKLSAIEKSAAQAEANTLFRKGEAEKIAESGGTAEDYRKSMGMDKAEFVGSYGEGANIQDIIKSEQQYAERQKEERRAKAKENRTVGEYFYGTDVESRSDTAVKEQLAIRQAEARKRREEAAAQQQAPPDVTATGGVQAAGGVTDTRPAIVNPTPYMDWNNINADITPEQQTNIDRLFTSGQKEHLDNWQKQQRSQKQEVQQYKQEESTSKQIKGAIPAASESVYRKEQAQQSGQPSVGIDPELLNRFSSALEKFNSDFSANIDRLENTKFKIELAPTSINVNLTGGSFLENLKGKIKSELLAEVGEQIRNQGFNPDGSPRSRQGTQLG